MSVNINLTINKNVCGFPVDVRILKEEEDFKKYAHFGKKAT